MVDDEELAAIERALRAMAPRCVVGARRVGDAPTHPGEHALYAGMAPRARHATATGRQLVRALLCTLGVSPAPLLRAEGGGPAWPPGIGGSIAHDDDVAVALLWIGGDASYGVDVEPALPLPDEIVDDVVLTAAERSFVAGYPVRTRAVFAAKEAVFKATWPVHRVFLEHRDVRLTAPSAVTPSRAGAADDPFSLRASCGAGPCDVDVAVVTVPRILAVARFPIPR